VIADVGDRMLDSWLILGGNSLKCERLDGEKESLVSSLIQRQSSVVLFECSKPCDCGLGAGID